MTTSHRARAIEDDPLGRAFAKAGRARQRVASHRRRSRLAIAATDALCALATLGTGHVVFLGWRAPSGDFAVVLLVAPIVWVAVFRAVGLYEVGHLSASEEFRRLIVAASAASAGLVTGAVWWDAFGYRRWLVLTVAVGVAFELATRRVWRWRLRKLRRDGPLTLRTVVIGTNDEASAIIGALERPALGFDVVGCIETSAPSAQPTAAPVVGTVDALRDVIERLSVDCLFVASTAASPAEMVRILRSARVAGADVRVSANLPEILTSRLCVEPLGEVLSISIRPVRLTGAEAAVKRSFDLLVASSALVALLPVLAVIALAVRLTSRGPVLFRQQRVTQGGRVFTIYKFRTMLVDGPHDDRVIDLTQPFFKLRDDPRLTRIGKFLRTYSLDELPQLWHVVRGDLSLVGPRPLWSIQVDPEADDFIDRHEVKAGITGWWQINGRNDVESPARAIEMDLFYINNWSLSLDLFILLKTVGSVIRRRGAY